MHSLTVFMTHNWTHFKLVELILANIKIMQGIDSSRVWSVSMSWAA